MPQEQRPLFREHALQHYLQKREKDILPHFVSPPIFVCAWIPARFSGWPWPVCHHAESSHSGWEYGHCPCPGTE